MTHTIWTNYGDTYLISIDGEALSYAYNSPRKLKPVGKPYAGYSLGGRRVDVHRLIGELFLDNPNSLPFVLHKDDNKANNTIENLYWGTEEENARDARRNKKLVTRKVALSKNGLRTSFDSIADVARHLGVAPSSVSQALKKFSKVKGYYVVIP